MDYWENIFINYAVYKLEKSCKSQIVNTFVLVCMSFLLFLDVFKLCNSSYNPKYEGLRIDIKLYEHTFKYI